MRFKSITAALVLCLFATPALARQAPATTVKPGKQIDSIWNGALIGAAAGIVPAWIFTRANCGPRGYDDECSAIAGPVGVLIFVPAGAVTGAVIDRLINKTLPPGTKAHAAISPVLAQRGARRSAGVALSLKIRF
jgi:hypothetical protein